MKEYLPGSLGLEASKLVHTDRHVPIQGSKMRSGVFLGGPVAKDLPSNAGDTGPIPGWELRAHTWWAAEPACHTREKSTLPQRKRTHACRK